MSELATLPYLRTSNLKAYYMLEGGALTTDSSGNGYTLTNNNSVGEITALYGGGAYFGSSNTNKYLSIGSDLGLNKTLSMSCWVKLNSEISTGYFDFLGKRNVNGNHTFTIGYDYNGGTRRIYFQHFQQTVGSDTQSSIFKTVTLGTSSWHHFALCSNGTNFYCYHNGGSSIGTGTVQPNGTFTVNTRFHIGCGALNINNFSSAIIDDVLLYATALSADDVAQLASSRVQNNFLQMF